MPMRKINILVTILVIFLSLSGCAQDPTFFNDVALNDSFEDLNGEEVTFKSILEANEGHTILLDIWASWCKDCVVGMPRVKELQEDFPGMVVVFISLDKDEASWKKGIEKFNIGQGLHFWAKDGWESELFQEIDLDWIPRYMVLDAQGNITLYKAIKASDKAIVKQLIENRS